MNGIDMNGLGNSGLFAIEQVQLMFSLTDIVTLVVSNNILCMALKSGRIIRIDLDHPEAVDDIDLPQKSQELGTINGLFLDPTGSFLVITTSSGENYTLNYQSVKPKPLGRLKGLKITSVGWSPMELSRSTGNILVGTADGAIYETLIEPSNEYFKREDRFVRQVWKNPNANAIIGLHVGEGSLNERKVLAASKKTIWFWCGRVSKQAGAELLPAYPKYFEREEPLVEEFGANEFDSFSISPQGGTKDIKPMYAWINNAGILHGQLSSDPSRFFKDAHLLMFDQLSLAPSPSVRAIMLTEYHIILLQGNNVYAINRLNNQTVFHETIPCEPNEHLIGLCSDKKFSTFWAYSNINIFEVKVIGDEDREIWKALFSQGDYESAYKLAKDAYSKDLVSSTYGEELLKQSNYEKAAIFLGNSSRPFERCVLAFMEVNEFESLHVYLEAKLKNLRKTSLMQRTLITGWIIESYMEKLDSLDDNVAAAGSQETKDEFTNASESFRRFIQQYKNDLDKNTVYEIISSHGRKEELLKYAASINDSTFVLSYWIRAENWEEALHVLRVENDTKLVYKYATVLLINSPKETVNTWMRISDLDAVKLIPSLLRYTANTRTGAANQAIRYLKYAIDVLKIQEPVIHNTLISIYASSPDIDESALLQFLEDYQLQMAAFDFDFALRICNQFNRTQCAVHIYSAMGLYEEAVRLALRKGDIDLAMLVADRPMNDISLRKSLWLDIAGYTISQKGAVEEMVELMKKCELLKIEDLLPLIPDFVAIDHLKDQVTTLMESYNDNINELNREMEESVMTSSNVKKEVEKYRKRFVLIEPGERCCICGFPVASRRFYVFPCQHSYHYDCLLESVSKSNDHRTRARLNEARISSSSTVTREPSNAVDEILSEKCQLCSESNIDNIDAPLTNHSNAWVL